MWRFCARLLLDGAVSDFHCDVDIAASAFDVVGIEHFGIPPFQKMAFATRFTVVKALPCILDKGQPLFPGGVVYFGWLHIVIKLNDCHFYHTIQFVLKDAVGLFDFTQWETVCDERCGVDPPLLYQTKHLFAVAAIHSSGLEGEVLAIHFW